MALLLLGWEVERGEKCRRFKNRFGVPIFGRRVRGKAMSACWGGRAGPPPAGSGWLCYQPRAARAAPGRGLSVEGQGEVCGGPRRLCLPCWGQPPWGGGAPGPPRFGLLPQLCPCACPPPCPWQCRGLTRDPRLASPHAQQWCLGVTPGPGADGSGTLLVSLPICPCCPYLWEGSATSTAPGNMRPPHAWLR